MQSLHLWEKFFSQKRNIFLFFFFFQNNSPYLLNNPHIYIAQSAGSVEYTDCTSAEG